jgi:hypothetical protein
VEVAAAICGGLQCVANGCDPAHGRAAFLTSWTARCAPDKPASTTASSLSPEHHVVAIFPARIRYAAPRLAPTLRCGESTAKTGAPVETDALVAANSLRVEGKRMLKKGGAALWRPSKAQARSHNCDSAPLEPFIRRMHGILRISAVFSCCIASIVALTCGCIRF